MTGNEWGQLPGLPDVIGLDGKTLFNALKQSRAERPGRTSSG
ncbi:hypothetical protein [Streptomyces sp. WMMC940]|nr:hypothetical protein [Streptomyces sp. WMMC940]MCZ7457004.1 hypothetical protein [Streptomyces sp. WMMC940]